MRRATCCARRCSVVGSPPSAPVRLLRAAITTTHRCSAAAGRTGGLGDHMLAAGYGRRRALHACIMTCRRAAGLPVVPARAPGLRRRAPWRHPGPGRRARHPAAPARCIRRCSHRCGHRRRQQGCLMRLGVFCATGKMRTNFGVAMSVRLDRGHVARGRPGAPVRTSRRCICS